MPRAIGFLVYPGFQLLDATGPIAAFEIAGRLSPGAYSLHFLSLRGGLVPSTSGMVVQTTRSTFTTLPPAIHEGSSSRGT